MAIEIERKYLVNGAGWETDQPLRLSQAYLNRDPERTVRVRVVGEEAWLTIKGLTTGRSRAEFEYPIPIADAEQLLKLCESPPLEKLRHIVSIGGKYWEVDQFLGENAGLVVAEIELASEDEAFEKPSWLGPEVTEDRRYFNSQLVSLPYRRWPEVRDDSALQ